MRSLLIGLIFVTVHLTTAQLRLSPGDEELVNLNGMLGSAPKLVDICNGQNSCLSCCDEESIGEDSTWLGECQSSCSAYAQSICSTEVSCFRCCGVVIGIGSDITESFIHRCQTTCSKSQATVILLYDCEDHCNLERADFIASQGDTPFPAWFNDCVINCIDNTDPPLTTGLLENAVPNIPSRPMTAGDVCRGYFPSPRRDCTDCCDAFATRNQELGVINDNNFFDWRYTCHARC